MQDAEDSQFAIYTELSMDMAQGKFLLHYTKSYVKLSYFLF